MDNRWENSKRAFSWFVTFDKYNFFFFFQLTGFFTVSLSLSFCCFLSSNTHAKSGVGESDCLMTRDNGKRLAEMVIIIHSLGNATC